MLAVLRIVSNEFIRHPGMFRPRRLRSVGGRWIHWALESFLDLQRKKGQSRSLVLLRLKQPMGAFAEFERSLIRERQREGIDLAKKKGIYKGRKPSLDSAKASELRRRANNGENKAALAREFGISRAALYVYLAA